MQSLTKPQAAMLTKAMRESVALSGSSYRVAGRLSAMGFGEVEDHTFRVNGNGLTALRDYRRRLWGARGCHADLLNLDEVEAALKQFA